MLEFEKPIDALKRSIEKLEKIAQEKHLDYHERLTKLKERLAERKKTIFSGLSPWQRVELARCHGRPHTADYINALVENFVELHGDRSTGDDPAIIAGLGKVEGKNIVLVGHQKGKDTQENLARNFGMAHPEGYRKALRLMEMAERFHMPVVTLIDTPGAHPGLEAEEKGQARAIGENLMKIFSIRTPIICIIIGEGGSGGALGIGIADKILMLENSIYSVISPEGCAAILWKSQNAKEEAAKALKLTATDLLEMKIIDEIIPEPLGGAHQNPEETIKNLQGALKENLTRLNQIPLDHLLELRYEKYRKIGVFKE
ncbi:MAG: acetyl-CoA carboxylase carboxyl transferase subunit alpha [bacterium (Candidatus Ratteibacteria) CG_4_10_14_3_um_filter_41_18]|uniref:Acetyl-coenzyme A carboxylase carboxyl transferase subunit alpha n=2 Tax=Candidatus Ratteibacteria TaxID=2979319 RepID=A0A2M7M4H2_9BACT|nr:MAG: acetyl-CoA carboxylase carboxyl transferase subunit alpha [bacterium (Candidatus Ratteibacteria) CG15_BIG_FIL_POST_REV_8_21_14_020_41_12]PIX77593.1 MAG: acetyl-CoA carboxylase carboxyl transferase subunit alpha [bacterium (Candidatus Ratteibacteria) CG_4_10_14_3_um_filter_41_18]